MHPAINSPPGTVLFQELFASGSLKPIIWQRLYNVIALPPLDVVLPLASSTPLPINILWTLPFVLLLAGIALMPFLHKHFWEHHYPKVSIGLALAPAIYYFAVLRQPGPWFNAMEEYVSFIILLASLFIISGGVVIRVNRKATPLANLVLLLLGAIVANIFGTTGASMLLIRPYLRMNRGHIKPFHIVFFIFIVSNCGGLLTPIGDPPLFLGYLKGVPFRWTLDYLWPIWVGAIVALLAVFFVIDTLDHRKVARIQHPDGGVHFHILGIHNFIFIAAVLLAVFRPGIFPTISRLAEHGPSIPGCLAILFSREMLMALAAVASRRFTSKEIYTHNEFSFGPIREVAILFLGIFSTLAPALGWLEQNATKLTVKTPGQCYFSCGALSSVLDNAPTYMVFLKMQMGRLDPTETTQAQSIVDQMQKTGKLDIPPEGSVPPNVRTAVQATVIAHRDEILDRSISPDAVRVAFLTGIPSLNAFLIAISAGSVLFGACTYIGNGPNFMVKSIADAAGVKTPGFIGYILCYTLPILLPIYVSIWWLFVKS